MPQLPRDAWVVLGGDTLSAVGSGLTLPFLLVYLSRVRDIDLVTAGLAVSTVALAGLAGNPVGGWLTDRLGSKRSLVCGLTIAAAGAFLIAGVRSPWQAFVAVSVAGFGAAVVVPSQDALLAVVVEPADRSAVFAVRNATLNAGYGVGAIAASLIVDLGSSASFVLLYVVDGLTFLAFIPVLWLLLPGAGVRPAEVRRPGQGQPRSGYAVVLRDRTFLRTWVLIALLVAAGFSQTLAAFPVFATGGGGISAAALSIAFAINTVIVVVVQLPVLRLMEGHRRTTGIVVACALWATAWSVTFLAGQLAGTSAVERHLEAVAASSATYRIHLRGSGTFRPVSPVVFVNLVEGISQTEQLAGRCRRGPLALELGYPYHPHVTIAHLPDDVLLDRAFDELSSFDCGFTVAEFHLYVHDADHGWKATHDYALTGSAP